MSAETTRQCQLGTGAPGAGRGRRHCDGDDRPAAGGGAAGPRDRQQAAQQGKLSRKETTQAIWFRLGGQLPASATRLVSLHDPTPGRSARAGSTARSGSATRPRSATTTTASSWTMPSSTAPHPTARGWRPRCSASPAAPAGCRARSPPTEATASSPSSVTCTNLACAPWPSPPGHDLRRPQDTRAPPRLPQAGQMANRLRRADQLPHTRLRLGPHPPGRQARSRDLVRARVFTHNLVKIAALTR
jgi:hypothetical protein